MLFILQKEKLHNSLDLEVFLVDDILRQQKHIHSYVYLSKDDFFEDNKKTFKNIKDFPENFIKGIPIGTIDFVAAWLKIFKNVENMNPIEIPKVLRTQEFLKREYAIVTSDKIPRKGKYFIKDVSQLKAFSSLTYNDLQYLDLDAMLKSPNEIKELRKKSMQLFLDNTHLFQVSERVNCLSEYRVYIIDGKIQSISHYNGDPCILPDVKLIQKANLLYSMEKDYPKSYTIDIMVNERGTSLIELHPWSSIGLYSSLWGSNLLYAYVDGIDYYVNYNTPIQKS